MFENLKQMNNYPNEDWLNQIRKDNYLFLPKSNTFAICEWEYSPPDIGHICGRIGLKLFSYNKWECQSWFIRQNGKGIDFSQLLIPVEGHLSDNPTQLPEPEIRYIYRQIDALEERYNSLRNKYSKLEDKINLLMKHTNTISNPIEFVNLNYKVVN